MIYSTEIRILYSDTDSYGVVWHGAYTKWFEAGRVELVEKLGLPLETLEKQGVTFPVIELNIRYRSSAHLNERVIIETGIEELKATSAKFYHKVTNKETCEVRTTATSTIVAVDKEGKLYRRLPNNIADCFKKAFKVETLV